METNYGKKAIDGLITNLLVADINNDQIAHIIVGNSRGDVFMYDKEGVLLAQTRIDGPVEHILVREQAGSKRQQLLAVSENLIFAIEPEQATRIIIANPNRFTTAYLVNPASAGEPTALATISDQGYLSLYDEDNVQSAHSPTNLNGRSLTSLHYQHFTDLTGPEPPLQDALLIATDADTLLNLHLQNDAVQTVWEMADMPGVTSLFYGNLDEDNLPDIAVGDENGAIYFIDEAGAATGRLNVVSSVFALNPVASRDSRSVDLLVTTDNGLVQLFRAKENRPPLLTNPQIDVVQERASFTISVRDTEKDDVTVDLALFDPASQKWLSQGKKVVNGSGNPVWPGLSLPETEQAVRYRFTFDDGFHTGSITPPPIQPQIPQPTPQPTSRFLFLGLGVVALSAVILLWRQTRTSSAQAGRLYRRLNQQPEHTLILLEDKYAQISGAPDFFVNLANEARQQVDLILTNLADGLFLLADRPQAGLSILIHALEEAGQRHLRWTGLARWTALSKTTQLMLDAPTITELSLLRPQLAELLMLLAAEGKPSPLYAEFLPILTNLRDSERVERTDDRLVYLNEANLLTNLQRTQLSHYPVTIDHTLGTAVIQRWSGLLSAEIEELRGQADLQISLKTKHLLPLGQTDVMLEISNNGRSPAENIMVQLDANPAYDIHSDPKIISNLPPRRTWQINFTIEPKVTDRFRLSLTITYDDRHKRDRQIAFGDMVYLLIPSRQFRPIPNPTCRARPCAKRALSFTAARNCSPSLRKTPPACHSATC